MDKTYYQTIKGMVTPLDILEPGGTLIIASDCSEGPCTSQIYCVYYSEPIVHCPSMAVHVQYIHSATSMINMYQEITRCILLFLYPSQVSVRRSLYRLRIG